MRILHLEDSPEDAELVQRAIAPDWPDAQITVVVSRNAFVAALRDGGYDVILSDFKLPGFDGRDALALAQEFRREVPLIFVSGTIGEDVAAEVVREGAADYLVKGRLARLPQAIRQALKQAEDRRRRQEAESRIHEQAELLNKVKDGIVAFSLGNRVLYWNRGAARIFGWSADEAIGRSITDLFGGTVESTFNAMERQMRDPEEWRAELSFVDKAGRPLLCEVRMTVVRDAGGHPTSRLAVVTDITDRKQLEAQLQRAQRLESLGMLAAGIAHDLNNALAPMLMAGGLLRSRVTDPADIRLVELLEQSAQRGAALVKQIVSFAGARTRERVLVDPKHLLNDILQLVRDTFPKSIELRHEVPSGLWPVQGNPTQLHQVLLNLCINARDAMPKGGVLRLSARNEMVTADTARSRTEGTPGRFLVIEVADSGIGMSAEVLRHMWDPFYTTKAEGEGTGLGLSTVRGIVGDHGGFLDVVSEVGHGATFRVYLPAVAQDGVTVARRKTGAHPFGRGRGELVLVVDDQESVRESIGVVLAKSGYRPLTVGDGLEALSKYADRIRHLAAVITDLDMPGLNGMAFAESVLRLNPALKVLFISGTAESTAAGPLVGTTAATFLQKPFTPEALLDKVDALLNPGA